MITTIRKSFTKGAKETFGIIILFVLISGVLFVPGAMENIGSGIWAIQVNDRPISYQSYMQEVIAQRDKLNAFRAQYGQFADYFLASMGISSDPKQLAINLLIKQELINQLSDQLDIVVDSAYINEKLHDKQYVQSYLQDIVPLFLFENDEVINLSRLEKILPKMGLKAQEFQEKVEHAVSQQFLMSLLGTTLYTPEFDAAYASSLKKAQRKYSKTEFSFEDMLTQAKKTDLTNEEVASYFESKNRLQKKYWVPEKRTGIIWKINAQDYNISVSKNQIADYYEDHKTQKYVDTPSQVIMQQIVETDKTGPLADIYQDILSGDVNLWKDVNPFSRGTYDTEIERVAFTMKKDDISPIIITKNGVSTVIKLIDRTSRIYKPLSSVEKEIRSTLMNEYFKKQFVAEVTNIIKHQEDTFDDFIAQHGLKPINVKNALKADEHGKQLFGIKKQGEYEIYTKDSVGYIIKLTSIAPSFEPELESVFDIVKNDIYQERAQELLKLEIQSATKKLASNESTYETTSLGWIDPTDKAKEKDLQKQGIPLYLLNNLEKKGSVVSHEAADKGTIFILEDINLPTGDDFSKVDTDFNQMRKALTIEGLVASLYRNAKIETNETIIIAGEEYSA